MSAAPVDVLVVGAGPSGLFAAAELARHGVRSRVVEREPEPHHQARATALQPGTLEILWRAGILDDVLAASVQLPFARVFDAELRQLSEIAFAGAGCRWEFQCSLPQWRTEQILTARLAELGGVVERGVSASSLEVVDDRVRVTLEQSDGALETVEVQRVIGAGGAHSVTRESMTEVLMGETYPGSALVADIRLRCGVPRDNSALVATPEGYVLLASLPDERWITFIGDLHEDEVERFASDLSIDSIRDALERRIKAEIRLEDVAWAAPFWMHHRIVSRLGARRLFLLGDAGHLSSPFGGEGLNSGLHDGHNLSWKLALVLRGQAHPRLLDSFGTERLAADRHVLQVSDRLHGLAQSAVQAAQTGVRPAPPTPEQVAAVVRSRSMLDVSYAGRPIVGESLAPGEESARELVPGDRYPHPIALGTAHLLMLFDHPDDAEVGPLRERWRGLVDVVDVPDGGSKRSGLVLVRPDGYIGFRASAVTGAAMAALDAHLASYLVSA